MDKKTTRTDLCRHLSQLLKNMLVGFGYANAYHLSNQLSIACHLL